MFRNKDTFLNFRCKSCRQIATMFKACNTRKSILRHIIGADKDRLRLFSAPIVKPLMVKPFLQVIFRCSFIRYITIDYAVFRNRHRLIVQNGIRKAVCSFFLSLRVASRLWRWKALSERYSQTLIVSSHSRNAEVRRLGGG